MSKKDIIQEERLVVNFSMIELRDFGHVILKQGEVEHLVVETTSELMPYMITEVKGETLQLRIRQSWLAKLLTGSVFSGIEQIKYLITLKEIRALSIFGDGLIEAEHLKTNRLDLDTHGQGQVRIDNLSTDTLCVTTHGQAKVSIAGEISRQDISVHGSGEVDLSQATNQSTTLKIQGNGIVKLWCNGELNVSISGMGKVYYQGNPTIKQRLSGLGELIQIER